MCSYWLGRDMCVAIGWGETCGAPTTADSLCLLCGMVQEYWGIGADGISCYNCDRRRQ